MTNKKFRAWDKKRKCMKDVKIINFEYETVIIGDFNVGVERSFHEVEIMESINKKDIYGIDIYEGDIVVNSDGKFGHIAWEGTEFVLVSEDLTFSFNGETAEMSYEIIGNIYLDNTK